MEYTFSFIDCYLFAGRLSEILITTKSEHKECPVCQESSDYYGEEQYKESENIICITSSETSQPTIFSIPWSLVRSVAIELIVHLWVGKMTEIEICSSEDNQCSSCGSIIITNGFETNGYSSPTMFVKCNDENMRGNQVKLTVTPEAATLCLIHVFGYGKYLIS